MKKLYICISVFSFAALTALAQPTLTAAGCLPVVGDAYTSKTFTATPNQQGSSGANQTWNFSALIEENTSSGVMVNPSTTPYYSSYPSATLCAYSADQGSYDYTMTSGTGLFRVGLESVAAGVSMNYTDHQQELKFPFTFNNTFSDAYTAEFTGPGYTGTRTGNQSFTADAWGTLLTPAGTYTNVLRIHVHDIYTDDYDGLGSFTVTLDNYFFYKEGTHWPLMNFAIASDGINTTYAGAWSVSGVGINEVDAQLYQLSVYPNPVGTKGNISYTLRQSGRVGITISDAQGRMVKKFDDVSVGAGIQTVPVDASELSNGIYVVALTVDEQTAMTKMIVQH